MGSTYSASNPDSLVAQRSMQLKATLGHSGTKPTATACVAKVLRSFQGLEENVVRSARDIYALLDRGSAKRRTAETLLNKQSSRSHSVFCITVRPAIYSSNRS